MLELGLERTTGGDKAAEGDDKPFQPAVELDMTKENGCNLFIDIGSESEGEEAGGGNLILQIGNPSSTSANTDSQSD